MEPGRTGPGRGDDTQEPPGVSRRLLFAGALLILTVAASMRAPITAVGPLLEEIQASVGLSSAAAGLLTALPLFAFAILSPFGPGLARNFGLERVLFGALVILSAGIALRSVPAAAALFLGTLLVGGAIALANVLLPALVKRDFALRAGLLTGLYTATMGAVAALASGVSVPLAAAGTGWRTALGVWGAIALVGALLWLPRARAARSGPAPAASEDRRRERGVRPFGGLLGSGLAWQVTLFMGLQSVIFYVCITWLPAILTAYGQSPVVAGWMVSLMQVVGIPAALLAPLLAERCSSQSLLLAAAAGASAAGISGLLFFGATGAMVWVALLGVGQGACISLALTLFALRTSDSEQAGELSGMGQSFGYLLAAASPLLFGALYDSTLSWSEPLISLLVISAVLMALGLLAGRNLRVKYQEAR